MSIISEKTILPLDIKLLSNILSFITEPKELFRLSRISKLFRYIVRLRSGSKNFKLELCSDKINDEQLYLLSNIKQLKIMNSDKLTSKSISKLLNLEKLEIHNNNTILSHVNLNIYPRLYHLKTNSALSNLTDIVNIHSVDLSKNKYIYDHHLKYFSHVKKINLSDTLITDHGLEFLASVPDIRVENCNITDEGLKFISGVNILDISFCKNITDLGISYLTNINRIKLWCTNLTDKALQYLQNAIAIDMKWCHLISGYGLNYLKKTVGLNISLTRMDLNHLSIETSLSLKILDIAFCLNVDGDIIKKISNLQKINIFGCNAFLSVDDFSPNVKINVYDSNISYQLLDDNL